MWVKTWKTHVTMSLGSLAPWVVSVRLVSTHSHRPGHQAARCRVPTHLTPPRTRSDVEGTSIPSSISLSRGRQVEGSPFFMRTHRVWRFSREKGSGEQLAPSGSLTRIAWGGQKGATVHYPSEQFCRRCMPRKEHVGRVCDR